MNKKYPQITHLNDGSIQISYPMERPYEKEVISIMQAHGYELTGKGFLLLGSERDLVFKLREKKP